MVVPKFRAWFGTEMYNNPVVYDGCFYLDWRDFEDGRTFEGVILMQSTGLFDKNGIEIFEGDVVDLTDEGGLATIENPFVKIERDISGFIVVGDFPDSPITLKAFEEEREFMGADVRVVGNIYENPELLEEVE